MKDCLKNDRARIQVGHISHFGLLEMSRQRIRISVLESTTQPCPHCAGTGNVRSESSIALHVMRSIEEYLLHNPQHNITVRTPVATALYVLNHKRNILVNLEARFKLNISIEADDNIGTQHLIISKGTIAEAISQSPLVFEDDNKKEIEDAILIESEPVEDKIPVEKTRNVDVKIVKVRLMAILSPPIIKKTISQMMIAVVGGVVGGVVAVAVIRIIIFINLVFLMQNQ